MEKESDHEKCSRREKEADVIRPASENVTSVHVGAVSDWPRAGLRHEKNKDFTNNKNCRIQPATESLTVLKP